MFSPETKKFIEAANVCRIATVTNSGGPHIAPFCFAFNGIDRIYIGSTSSRVLTFRNIGKKNEVAVLIDEYYGDWKKNVLVLIRGSAETASSGEAFDEGSRLIVQKYGWAPKIVAAVTVSKVVKH